MNHKKTLYSRPDHYEHKPNIQNQHCEFRIGLQSTKQAGKEKGYLASRRFTEPTKSYLLKFTNLFNFTDRSAIKCDRSDDGRLSLNFGEISSRVPFIDDLEYAGGKFLKVKRWYTISHIIDIKADLNSI